MFAEHKHDRSATFKQLPLHPGVRGLQFVTDNRPAEWMAPCSAVSGTLNM